jgi:hypothetical protein
MSFHYGTGPGQINEVVALPQSQPTGSVTASVKAPASAAQKSAKPPVAGGRNVVGYELVFKSSVTGAEVSVQIPAVGVFHDPKRRITVREVRALGVKVASALNDVLHDVPDKGPAPAPNQAMLTSKKAPGKATKKSSR